MLKRKNAADGQHSIANRDGEIDPEYLVPVQLGMCISRMVTGSFSGLNIVVSLGDDNPNGC